MIPFEALDKFYFDTFIPSLHPSIRSFAVDRRLLRHETSNTPLKTIKDLYQRQYLYIPYMLAEHFPLDDERLLTLGQAWILQIIDFVITDNIIDAQAPDNPLLVLFHQQLNTQSEALLHQLMPNQPVFWEHYYMVKQALHNANALEIYCVDQHQRPYSLAIMEEIYSARSEFFSLAIHIISILTHQEDQIVPFTRYYHDMSLSDQLLDDAADWRDDFRGGRYTLPIIKALKVAEIDYTNAHILTEDDLDDILKKSRILQEMAQTAQDRYLGLQQMLKEINSLDSLFNQFLQKRIEVAEHAIRRYDGINFLQSFRRSLLD